MLKNDKLGSGMKVKSGLEAKVLRGYQPVENKPVDVDKIKGAINSSVKNNGNVAQDK